MESDLPDLLTACVLTHHHYPHSFFGEAFSRAARKGLSGLKEGSWRPRLDGKCVWKCLQSACRWLVAPKLRKNLSELLFPSRTVPLTGAQWEDRHVVSGCPGPDAALPSPENPSKRSSPKGVALEPPVTDLAPHWPLQDLSPRKWLGQARGCCGICLGFSQPEPVCSPMRNPCR